MTTLASMPILGKRQHRPGGMSVHVAVLGGDAPAWRERVIET